MKFEKGKILADLPVIFLALFNICIHLLVINNLEYHRDELLYFSLGQHPDFGYATVPPMIGWIAWFMQNVFGYSLFAVRLFPALLSGVMVLLVSAVAREFGGSSYSGILASIGFIISVFALRTYSLYMPVQIDLFFWTLVIYLLLRYINTSSDKTLIWLGIVMGLSLLNKYLIGVLFICLICVVPFTPNRKVIKNKNFWIGISVGILVFLPNVIWQFVNGLPVFFHLSELGRTQLVHVDRIAFLTDQIIMPSWASVLTIAGLIFLFRNKESGKFRFLGIVSILVVVLLIFMRGKSYYTIGIFPFLISAGAVWYERWLERKWIRIAVPVLLILLTIPMIPFGLPVYKSEGLVKYFRVVESKYGIKLGRRFED